MHSVLYIDNRLYIVSTVSTLEQYILYWIITNIDCMNSFCEFFSKYLLFVALTIGPLRHKNR